jgi:hypothetical protein
MCGCSEQKYSYTPGVVNVKEKLPSVSSIFDLNSFVCGVSSALSQATVVPAFTVMRSGEKAKLSISTLLSGAGAEITRKLIAAATRMPAAKWDGKAGDGVQCFVAAAQSKGLEFPVVTLADPTYKATRDVRPFVASEHCVEAAGHAPTVSLSQSG